MERVKDEGDEAFYDKLDSAYSADDDDSEVSLSLCIIIKKLKEKRIYVITLHFVLYFCVKILLMYRWRMVRKEMKYILRAIIVKMIVKLKVKLKVIMFILQPEEFSSRS